jgi:hypothetical protein
LLRFALQISKAPCAQCHLGAFLPCKLQKQPINRDFCIPKWSKNPQVQQAAKFCRRFLIPVLLLVPSFFPLGAQENPADSEEVSEPAGDAEFDERSSPVIEAVPKGFFSFFSFSLGTAVVVFPESDELKSDPMPILPSPHIALGFPIMSPGSTTFGLEMSLDLYWTHYAYSEVLQRPVPAAIENRSSMVIGPILGLQFQGKTGIGPVVFARYFLGASVDLRIVLIAEDLNERDLAKASNETELTHDYFWDEYRWIFPFAGVGIDFKISPGLSFGIDGRVWVPLSLWRKSEEVSGFDGWRFGIGFRITFLNETHDKTIGRDIDRIKKKYAVDQNDYAFILYHLSKNPPFYGIEPSRLADEIAKAYRHSGLYREARAGISSGKVVDMFTDVPTVEKDYSYDPMGNVIRMVRGTHEN